MSIRVRVVDEPTPRPEVEGVEVSTTGGELAASDPREVPWGVLFDQAIAAGATVAFARSSGEWPVVSFADRETVREQVKRLRRRRGRSLAPEHLDKVREVAEANPKRPAAAVAEQWDVPKTTAEYWVKRARETQED